MLAPTNAFDLVIASLIDEHLPDLTPLYAEASRLSATAGRFVTVSYHPQFMMLVGMPTHYTTESGEPLAITTHLHLLSEHVNTAVRFGWRLLEAAETLVDDAWIAAKPSWTPFRNHPFSMALVWERI